MRRRKIKMRGGITYFEVGKAPRTDSLAARRVTERVSIL
jgi:hypothetical protein